jgi:hypothetical protein
LTPDITTFQDHINEKLILTLEDKTCSYQECQAPGMKTKIIMYSDRPNYYMFALGRIGLTDRKIMHPIQINENVAFDGTNYTAVMSVVHKGPSINYGHYFAIKNNGI